MSMEYNGKKPELTVYHNNSVPGDIRLEFISTASAKIGTHLNTFDVKIYNDNDDEVSDQYWVVKSYGKLTITSRALVIKAGDAEKVYDGKPLTCNDYTIEQGELAEGHKISLITMSGSQTEMGRSENIITYVLILDENQKDVTDKYSFKFESGRLKVTFK